MTMASNVDFLVELEALHGVSNDRPIFYQTSVSNSATDFRHNFKRRQQLDSAAEKHSIFRFDRATTQSYDSVAKETVTVRVFEATPDNGKKHLETIKMYCCVLPSIKPALPGRASSVGSLLAGNATVPFTTPPRGGCLLKKGKGLSSAGAGSRLSPGPSLVL